MYLKKNICKVVRDGHLLFLSTFFICLCGPQSEFPVVSVHALDWLVQQTLFVILSNHLHPIPISLNTASSIKFQFCWGGNMLTEGWSSMVLIMIGPELSHFYPFLPRPLSESGLAIGILFHYKQWSIKESLLGPPNTEFLLCKKERCKALTPLSIKSALALSVSEFLFMQNYRSLLPKLHLVWYSIQKFSNLYTLVDLFSYLQGHCHKYVHVTIS